MAKITVHLLNYHGLVTHIDLVLEMELDSESGQKQARYYCINNLALPQDAWTPFNRGDAGDPTELIHRASSHFSFKIAKDLDPNEICMEWQTIHKKTFATGGSLKPGRNCADAVQWFLTKFADIPEPTTSNTSLNHLGFAVPWPSIVPCPLTLAGRVMDNAKFYVKLQEKAAEYGPLRPYAQMLFTALSLTASLFALHLATALLTKELAALAITVCAGVGLASVHGFFKAYNVASAQHIVKQEDFTPKFKTVS